MRVYLDPLNFANLLRAFNLTPRVYETTDYLTVCNSIFYEEELIKKSKEYDVSVFVLGNMLHEIDQQLNIQKHPLSLQFKGGEWSRTLLVVWCLIIPNNPIVESSVDELGWVVREKAHDILYDIRNTLRSESNVIVNFHFVPFITHPVMIYNKFIDASDVYNNTLYINRGNSIQYSLRGESVCAIPSNLLAQQIFPYISPRCNILGLRYTHQKDITVVPDTNPDSAITWSSIVLQVDDIIDVRPYSPEVYVTGYILET